MVNKTNSRLLQAALFATGLSGIVAEYVLSTLATYFLGNSVFQWTIVLSLMLFSMGLGSRLSRYFETNLLEKFLILEFILSILITFSALASYSLVAFTAHIDLIIYTFSIATGLLIGMEIPLVTRINEQNENLKANIANVMEKDYYGSLIGGVFFAFIGLPFLSLTYTPFVLGAINFSVACVLLYKFRYLLARNFKPYLNASSLAVFLLLVSGLVLAEPIVMFGEQSRYSNKVVFTKQTSYQQITVTQWKDDYWLYLNNSKQLCTFDEWLYHEPLVHPVMQLPNNTKEVLILGAGDGCAIREVLKYPEVEKITLVELDPEMTEIGANHPIFREMNQDAYHDPRVEVIHQDAFKFLEDTKRFFDVMILDFPDPRTIELNRLYTVEFYRLCHTRLRPRGNLVTQSASPFYTPKVYKSIEKTMQKAGFNTIPMHNHVYSFGEWSWVLGSKAIPQEKLKPTLQAMDFEGMELRWLNQEAMTLITSFGKGLTPHDSVEVNTVHQPVLHSYYEHGLWDIYF